MRCGRANVEHEATFLVAGLCAWLTSCAKSIDLAQRSAQGRQVHGCGWTRDRSAMHRISEIPNNSKCLWIQLSAEPAGVQLLLLGGQFLPQARHYFLRQPQLSWRDSSAVH